MGVGIGVGVVLYSQPDSSLASRPMENHPSSKDGEVRSAWETARGESFQNFVHGPIRPSTDKAPTLFEAPAEELYDITIVDFSSSQSTMGSIAGAGVGFRAQVAAQLGHTLPSHVWSDHATSPDNIKIKESATRRLRWRVMGLDGINFMVSLLS